MSSPIQKSVVYQAAIKIYMEKIERSPDSVSQFRIPGSTITYQQAEMREAARMAWAMVGAVDYTETER